MDDLGRPTDPEPIPDTFFAGFTYHIASSFPPARAEELDAALSVHGATRAESVHDEKLNLVVADSIVWEGWEVVEKREREARENESGASEAGGIAQGTHEPRPRLVEIVTDKWVDRGLLTGKLQNPLHFSANPSQIFSGVVACGTGLPTTDLEVISAGITGLGGQWRTGLTKEVTHLFAISAGTSKYSTALHYQPQTHIKILLPHWFDDAVRLGNGNLSTEEYEWPEPRLLKGIDGIAPLPAADTNNEGGDLSPEKQREKEREETKRNMYATAALFTPAMGASSPPSIADISLVSRHILNLSRSSPIPSDGVTPADVSVPQVWTGRRILLSRTLQLYKGRREAVQKGIERAGGVVVRFAGDDEEEEETEIVVKEDENESQQGATRQRKVARASRNEKERNLAEVEAVDSCDILVTRWRYGRAYVQAVRTRKTIGTLAWLFHVQSTGILARPLDQLLHYPVPNRPIDGFSKHVITVTNYTGEAREYLKKLITVMGATFTPSMSIQNTVLIAAHTNGTKSTKAHSWSIPVVNHTWLEDCFVQWRNLTPALERYIVFPPGVDFSALLGGRGVWVGSSVEVAKGAAENASVGDERRRVVLGKIELEAEEISAAMDAEDALPDDDDDEQARGGKEAAADTTTATTGADGAEGSPSAPTASARQVQALLDHSALREEEEESTPMDVDVLPADVDPLVGDWEFPAHLGGGNQEDRDRKSTPRATPKAKPTPKAKSKMKSPARVSGGVIELEDSSSEEGPRTKKKATTTPTTAKPKSKSKAQASPPPPSAKKQTPAKKTKKAAERAVSEVTSVEEDELEEEEEEEEARGRHDREGEDMFGDDTESFPSRVVLASSSKSTSKTKGKGKEKEKEKPSAAKSGGKRKVLMSIPKEEDEEEEEEEGENGDGAMEVDEDEVEVVRPKSKSKTKAKVVEKATPVATPASAKMPANKNAKGKRAAHSEDEDEDEDDNSAEEDDLPARVSPSKPTPKTKSKPAPSTPIPGSSSAKAKAQATSNTGNTSVSRAGGLLNRPKADARTRVKKKKVVEKEKVLVESEDEEEDNDEEEEEVVVVKGKNKGKVEPVSLRGKKAAPPVKKKGKGKKVASSSEEEEEEEEEEAKDEDEEEDEEEDEGLRPSRSNKTKSAPKSKAVPAASAASAKSNSKSQKASTVTRAKPLRVYSTSPSSVSEDESEEEVPKDVDDEGDEDEDSLPPAPHLLLKAEARRAATAKGKQKENTSLSAVRAKPGPASRAKGSTSSAIAKVTVKSKKKNIESETEEDVEDAVISKPNGKSGQAGTPKGNSTSVRTPKRVLSVLMPSLNLSATKVVNEKATTKATKKGVEDEASDDEEEDAVVVSVSKGKGKPTAIVTPKPKSTKAPSKPTVKPPSKSRAKGTHVASEEEEEDDDTEEKTQETEEEDEVSVLVSPRTRAVARTESIRAVSGQLSIGGPPIPAKARGLTSTKVSGKAITEKRKKATAMDVDEPAPGPSSHPRRNAATKATQRLHDTIMPDLITFEAQMRKATKARRTSGRGRVDAFVVDGEEDDEHSSSRGATRKRGSQQEYGDEEDGGRKKKRRVSDIDDGEDEVVHVTKEVKGKGKVKEKVAPMDVDEDTPTTGIMVMTTQVTLSDDTIKALTKLGVKMTTRPNECTHLLARQVVRTEKFLCALASAPWVLSEKWALLSAGAKRLLPEKDFILKDKAGEDRYGIDLSKSLRRAKDNKGKLLEGHTFYVTPRVPVDTKLLKSVVSACGGQLTTQTPSVRIINTSPDTRHVISCKEDISIWRPMRSLGIKVYTQELLLTGALNQQMEWDRDDFTVEM